MVDGYVGYSALFRDSQEVDPPVPSGIREAVGGADAPAAYNPAERSGSGNLAAGCTGETSVVADIPAG